MVVASQTWELSLPGCASLKQKRSVVRSIRDRLQAKFNVSVAETAFQDRHAQAEISVAVVASDRRLAEAALERTDRFVEENVDAVIVGVRREWHT